VKSSLQAAIGMCRPVDFQTEPSVGDAQLPLVRRKS
jgi:hypothetical protein